MARRIEHRVAGGDVNPYLALAAILGAALVGIEDEIQPSAPITGNAYDLDLPEIPGSWQEAIDAFDQSDMIKRIFEPDIIQNMLMTKRQELRYMAELSKPEQVEIYLDTV